MGKKLTTKSATKDNDEKTGSWGVVKKIEAKEKSGGTSVGDDCWLTSRKTKGGENET